MNPSPDLGDDFPDDERTEAGLGRLVAVERFGAKLGALPWFAHLGQPLLREEHRYARRYLDEIGFPEADLVPVRDWEEAAFAAENPGFDSAHWDAEEQLRAALTAESLRLIDEREFQLAFTRIAERIGQAAKRGVQEAASMSDVHDPALLQAAVGAAVQATHHRALVFSAAAGDEHPFVEKFSLFESGRWPIAVVGSTFHVF